MKLALKIISVYFIINVILLLVFSAYRSEWFNNSNPKLDLLFNILFIFQFLNIYVYGSLAIIIPLLIFPRLKVNSRKKYIVCIILGVILLLVIVLLHTYQAELVIMD